MDKNEYRQRIESMKAKLLEDGFIKVHFTLEDGNGETVWATPIGKKYAKIGNVPILVDDVSLDDIVEVVPSDGPVKEFKRLVNRGTYKSFVKWEVKETEDVTKAYFRKMCESLEAAGVRVGRAAPGISMVIFPKSMPRREAVRILETNPYITEYGFGYESDCDTEDQDQ